MTESLSTTLGVGLKIAECKILKQNGSIILHTRSVPESLTVSGRNQKKIDIIPVEFLIARVWHGPVLSLALSLTSYLFARLRPFEALGQSILSRKGMRQCTGAHVQKNGIVLNLLFHPAATSRVTALWLKIQPQC